MQSEDLDLQTLTRNQVDALNECIDLVKNGYCQLFAIIQHDWWFYKYKHMKNGRILIVEWKPSGYQIREGKKVLKNVPV